VALVRRMPSRSRPVLLVVAAVTWIAVVAVGFLLLQRYNATPGPSAVIASAWPEGVLDRDRTRPTVLLVMHPECPCSRASLGEFARVLARRRGRVAAQVLIAIPPGMPDAAAGDLVRQAQAIPGVLVTFDADARRTAAFGPLVSGHTLLYGRNGALLFEGGITASRGHAGDNVNEDALIAAIDGEPRTAHRAPVFGCLLSSTPS
ncbi:MAG TPA: hypothetical protein VMF13_10635, partial [Luteitalea sp.]|nr:hypothetical protein [Luteitalea sp.]